MNAFSDLWLSLASLATAGCIATALLWVKGAWKELADRQLSGQLDRARQLQIDPSSVIMLNRIRLPATVLIVTVSVLVWRNFAIAVAGAYLMWIAPVLVMDRLVSRRTILMRDQMVEAVVTLSNSVRASLDLANGLRRVAKDAPEPLAGEFRRIVGDLDAGRIFRDVICDAQTRLKLDGFTLFSAAVMAAEESGGPVTLTLENIARSLQENQRLERKLEAQTESGRAVVTLLAAAPVLFLAGSFLLFPDGATLMFSTIVGQVLLLVAFVIVMAGVYWSRHIMSAASR